jgi:transposase
MPGPKPTHKIELDPQQLRQVKQTAHSHTAPYAQVVRAKIIELAVEHPDYTNQQIAFEVACSDRTVRKWRSRYKTTASLEDAPRSGAPRRFSP